MPREQEAARGCHERRRSLRCGPNERSDRDCQASEPPAQCCEDRAAGDQEVDILAQGQEMDRTCGRAKAPEGQNRDRHHRLLIQRHADQPPNTAPIMINGAVQNTPLAK